MGFCKHERFNSMVRVNRNFADKMTDASPNWFAADVKINCADCGMPFEFFGVLNGTNPAAPTVDPTAQTMSVPIRPVRRLPALPHSRSKH